MATHPSPRRPARPEPADVHYRSGAVARMLQMPVATLRVWERRYGVSQPRLSPSGQRLYTADDVRRLALVKQLADLGHAIGSLAALDMPALQGVAGTHAQVLSQARAELLPDVPAGAVRDGAEVASEGAPCRIAVIGLALGRRLQHAVLRQHLGPSPQWLGPFESLAQAETALQPGPGGDLLLVHAPQLHAGWLAEARAAAPGLAALPMAVLYGFAAEAVCDDLARAGVALLREPQARVVLAQWLQGLLVRQPRPLVALSGPRRGVDAVPPRRWSDAALADFAGLSSTIACECPRHLAELLVQLSHFEAYSADCQHRSAADADLHAFLRQMAAQCRAQFEAALEHVARLEGLVLPDAPPTSAVFMICEPDAPAGAC